MPRLKIHALAVSAAILMNALPAVPLPARAAAFRPATIEDVRSIQSFVHDSDDYYAQEPADLNGDGCVDVFDLALAKRSLMEHGAPALVDFTADTWDIYLDTPTAVTFTDRQAAGGGCSCPL